MGLDMYLYAEAYTSEYTESELNESVKELFSKKLGDVKKHTESICVRFNIGYWRKANQIHNWFVQNAADGVDNCRDVDVSRGQLEELLRICKEVRESIELEGEGDERIVKDDTVALELLPPSEGFFFGSSNVDRWYVDDIDETITILTAALQLDSALFDFSYRASW